MNYYILYDLIGVFWVDTSHIYHSEKNSLGHQDDINHSHCSDIGLYHRQIIDILSKSTENNWYINKICTYLHWHVKLSKHEMHLYTCPNWVSHWEQMLVILSCWYLQFMQIKASMSLTFALCDWISLWHCKQPNVPLQQEVWKEFQFNISHK